MKQPTNDCTKQDFTTVIAPVQYHNGVLRIICIMENEHEPIASHREFNLLTRRCSSEITKFVFDQIGTAPDSIEAPIIDAQSGIILYIVRIPDNHDVPIPLSKQTLYQIEKILDFCEEPTRIKYIMEIALERIKNKF